MRRGRVPPDDRARAGAGGACSRTSALLRPGGVAYVSTPNLLTLAPPGRREVGQSLARAASTAAEEFRGARARARSASVELLGLFHARKLRAHELALRAGWDRVHAALGITKPFYDRFTPAISARDFTLRAGAARSRARLRRGAPALTRRPRTARSRSSSTRTCPTWRASAPGRSARNGCWEAVACVYLPLLDVLRRSARHARPHAGPVRPARGDAGRGRRSLPAVPARHPRADPRRGRRRPGRHRGAHPGGGDSARRG